MVMSDGLEGFSPQTVAWFRSAFADGPTPTQVQAWPAIRSGRDVLVISPTGSGKTLSAFLWAIDSLMSAKSNGEAGTGQGLSGAKSVSILYISPMKALGSDVAKNLQAPLAGIAREYGSGAGQTPRVRVGVRSGDSDSRERRALAVHPPDILVTTPESLYLMLTSKVGRTLAGVHTVIVDEIHALAGNKRGAHLALSLERLDALVGKPVQRIGLSATVKPPSEVARFLGGARPVTLIEPKTPAAMELNLVEPLADMEDLAAGGASGHDDPDVQRAAGSIWPSVERAVLDQVLAHRTTLVFVNSRGLAERLTARLNDLYAKDRSGEQPEARGLAHYDSATGSTSERSGGAEPAQAIAMAHHGSVSKERRHQVEQDLKAGRLRCVVATSSLELGIDMGSVDLVIQVNAPLSIASGLQRVGRADHQVGGVSHALLFPLTRQQILLGTASAEGMEEGDIEATVIPCNPLDILAQQTVAAASMEDLDQDAWYALVRRAAPFTTLDERVYRSVLAMLSGEFTSEGFTAFRPILVRDRQTGRIKARPGAQRLAVTSGGTIPDRGTYSVVMPPEEAGSKPRRVGELDEEMVYESRKGDVITLGTTSWLIQQITRDRVVVVPAPGRSARLPFWHGDGLGRDPGFGARVGALARDLGRGLEPAIRSVPGQADFVGPVRKRLASDGLDRNSIDNLAAFLARQEASTGVIPDDRTLVVERCPNEEGDIRLILHSPYGRRVHDPWALAISARLSRRRGYDGSVWAGDDGILVQIPQADADMSDEEIFLFRPDQIEEAVRDHLIGSALFQTRFRQCAARSLYMPRTEPGRRVPLWQQRLKASQLLDAALKKQGFPLVVETMRECLQDVYDMPALLDLMTDLESGRVGMVQARTESPSPMASNLLFGYLANFMYQYDMPRAERDSAVLSMDPEVLESMIGRVNMTALLDQDVVDQVESELQRLAPDRGAKGEEGLADLLRVLGPLSLDRIVLRMRPSGDVDEVQDMLASLAADKRVERIRMAGKEQWIWSGHQERILAVFGRQAFEQDQDRGALTEDQDPSGMAGGDTSAGDGDQFDDLVLQYAATHGPFGTEVLAEHLGLGLALVRRELGSLESRGLLLHGDFPRPNTTPPPEAASTQEQPLSRDLPEYQGSGSSPAGEDGAGGSRQDRLSWLHPEVFRILRARSLAKARKATRPVTQETYSAFLLEYQGLGPVGREPYQGQDGLLEVIAQLEGLYLPVGLWESAVFPSRIRDYNPSLLDGLLASGQVVWLGGQTGGEPLGSLAFFLVEDIDCLVPPLPGLHGDGDEVGAERAGDGGSPEDAMVAALQGGGAYRFEDLVNLCRSGESEAGSGRNRETMAETLWRLVGQGRVTNISMAPVRVLLQGFSQAKPTTSRRPPSRLRGLGRQGRRAPAMPQSASIMAADQGLWTLVRPAEGTVSSDQANREPGKPEVEQGAEASRLVQSTRLLIDRYALAASVLPEARESAGGFSAIYQVCQQMEDAGQLIRGVVVQDFGGAQFTSRETIEDLRRYEEERERPWQGGGSRQPEEVQPGIVMDVIDPANLYGAALDWPAPAPVPDADAILEPLRPIRRAGNLLVQIGGRAVLYAAPKGHRILVFEGADRSQAGEACRQLAAWLRRSQIHTALFKDVNGVSLGQRNPYTDAMRQAGFTAGPGGMRLY